MIPHLECVTVARSAITSTREPISLIIQDFGLNMRGNTDERTPEEGGQALASQAIEEGDTEPN